MADIRALMAQERQARRINHELASYAKSGVLMCMVCQLNIKSESLWEGHLRSANHKTNIKKAHLTPRPAIKRKLEDVDESQNEEDDGGRKKLKPKSRGVSVRFDLPQEDSSTNDARDTEDKDPSPEAPEAESFPHSVTQPSHTVSMPDRGHVVDSTASSRTAVAHTAEETVDENEWAAFERDMAPLAQPDYSAATITAAPVSAAQLEAEAETDKRRLRDIEAQDEKEDEERRIEEEFDVMEEMEERVRKLKEKRDALRLLGQSDHDTGQEESEQYPVVVSAQADTIPTSDEDSEIEGDDWYS